MATPALGQATASAIPPESAGDCAVPDDTQIADVLFDRQSRYLLNNAPAACGATAIQGYLPRDFRRYGDVRLAYSF